MNTNKVRLAINKFVKTVIQGNRAVDIFITTAEKDIPPSSERFYIRATGTNIIMAPSPSYDDGIQFSPYKQWDEEQLWCFLPILDQNRGLLVHKFHCLAVSDEGAIIFKYIHDYCKVTMDDLFQYTPSHELIHIKSNTKIKYVPPNEETFELGKSMSLSSVVEDNVTWDIVWASDVMFSLLGEGIRWSNTNNSKGFV